MKTNLNKLLSTLLAAGVIASASFNAFAHGDEHHDDDHEHAHEHHDHDHDHDHEGHEHHGKHVHGIATVQFALEDGTLKIEIDSPAINFLGFEHEPHDDAERAKVKTVGADLKKAGGFAIQGGNCKIKDVDVDLPEFTKETEHSDVEVSYEYQCAKNAKITGIDAGKLFATYEGLHEIDAQFTLNGKQGAQKLNKEASLLKF